MAVNQNLTLVFQKYFIKGWWLHIYTCWAPHYQLLSSRRKHTLSTLGSKTNCLCSSLPIYAKIIFWKTFFSEVGLLWHLVLGNLSCQSDEVYYHLGDRHIPSTFLLYILFLTDSHLFSSPILALFVLNCKKPPTLTSHSDTFL